MSSALVAVLAVAAPVAATDSSELRLLLLGMQDMATPQTLLRADMDIAVTAGGTTRRTQAVALFAPGKDAHWYIQLKDPATEALVVGGERKVRQQVAGRAESVPIGTEIDGTGIAYEDLARFVADDYKLWQITDEGTDTILVGMHPAGDSAYVYRAYLIDKEKKVPLRTQYYAKTLNNLAKLRVDEEHVLLGTKWLPTKISVEDYADGVNAAVTVRWTPNASAPPELLAPESFAAAPLLPWSAPAGASPAAATSPAR